MTWCGMLQVASRTVKAINFWGWLARFATRVGTGTAPAAIGAGLGMAGIKTYTGGRPSEALAARTERFSRRSGTLADVLASQAPLSLSAPSSAIHPEKSPKRLSKLFRCIEKTITIVY